MLDSHVVTYAETAREAKGSALRLARVSRGDKRPADLKCIREVADALKYIARGERPVLKPGMPSISFATAEGLGVVLHTAEQQGHEEGKDPVIWIAEMLEEIVTGAGQGDEVSEEVREMAALPRFFSTACMLFRMR